MEKKVHVRGHLQSFKSERLGSFSMLESDSLVNIFVEVEVCLGSPRTIPALILQRLEEPWTA